MGLCKLENVTVKEQPGGGAWEEAGEGQGLEVTAEEGDSQPWHHRDRSFIDIDLWYFSV